MHEDPRRAIVQVIARLGRETQLHLDERYRHFRITDVVIIATSLLLMVLAVFNVYYVRVLYEDLNGIVANMDSMYGHLVNVDDDMNVIAEQMAAFDEHMGHMEPIHASMVSLSDTIPAIRENMDGITTDMYGIEQSMGVVGEGMGIIDQRVYLMTGGVATMRQNVRQIARPLGGMNSFFP
jgi:methyl-accepting chemotaxis protein